MVNFQHWITFKGGGLTTGRYYHCSLYGHIMYVVLYANKTYSVQGVQQDTCEVVSVKTPRECRRCPHELNPRPLSAFLTLPFPYRNNMLEVADWLVVVGTVSIAEGSPGKRYRALQVLYHPRFNTYNNDYDVGLLRTITDMDMKGQLRAQEEHWLFNWITFLVYVFNIQRLCDSSS